MIVEYNEYNTLEEERDTYYQFEEERETPTINDRKEDKFQKFNLRS